MTRCFDCKRTVDALSVEFKSLVDNILIASAIAVMLSTEVIFNKLLRPLDVIESVTIILPSLPSRAIAAATATSLFRLMLISLPLLSTAPPRSTSVSKITPRSAPDSLTASQIESIASLASGFGTDSGTFRQVQDSGCLLCLLRERKAPCRHKIRLHRCLRQQNLKALERMLVTSALTSFLIFSQSPFA